MSANVTRTICLLLLFGGVAACSSEPKNRDPRGVLLSDTLSGRRRDSLIAESKLPGAKAVRKALDVSDSAAARLVPVDTIRP
jgi:hypothetical protein